jgi:N-acetylneuraminic acid mutarotase
VSTDPVPLVDLAPAGTRLVLPTPRSYLSVATVGDRIYALGGLDDGPQGLYHVSAAVEIYEPAARRWWSGSPLPVPRFSSSATVLDATIYVVGGHLEQDASPSKGGGRGATANPYSAVVDAYDTRTNRWSSRHAMLEARLEPMLAALGGALFVFGGSDGHTELQTVESYAPGSDAWTPRARMPRERRGGVALAIADRIVLVGGVGGDGNLVREIDIYDPARDRWARSSATVPERLWLPGAVVAGRSIVVTGGSFSNDAGMRDLAELRAYDVTTSRWSTIGKLAIARATHGAALVNKTLYVIGGCRNGCNDKVPEIETFSLATLTGATPTRVASVALPTAPTGPAGTCPFEDTTSHLCWQNPPADRSMSRGDAIAYCNALTDRGFDDWRLPTINELITLVRGKDMTSCKAVDPGCLDRSCADAEPCTRYAPERETGCYWPASLVGECSWYHASSKVVGAPYDAWYIYFDKASLQWGSENLPKHVRCVRGASTPQLAK